MDVFHDAGKVTFPSYAEYPVGKEPLAITAADLNGDGRIDLAVANHGGAGISVLLNHCW